MMAIHSYYYHEREREIASMRVIEYGLNMFGLGHGFFLFFMLSMSLVGYDYMKYYYS